MKVCSSHLDHMARMAAMSIYDKNACKFSSFEQKSHWPWGLVCSIGDMGLIMFEKITLVDLDLF